MSSAIQAVQRCWNVTLFPYNFCHGYRIEIREYEILRNLWVWNVTVFLYNLCPGCRIEICEYFFINFFGWCCGIWLVLGLLGFVCSLSFHSQITTEMSDGEHMVCVHIVQGYWCYSVSLQRCFFRCNHSDLFVHWVSILFM
jgi:hypothetical protein